ncbi:MAG TPA: hypothetical protein VF529_20530 [Solirubrobacteraceae bacterium]|jgi:hypothetical protein
MSRTVVIRTAAASEAAAVRRLAFLECTRPLRGEVLVAFVSDRPVAAIALATGRVVADPFERTEEAIELLREHARGVRTGRAEAHRAAARARRPRRPRPTAPALSSVGALRP